MTGSSNGDVDLFSLVTAQLPLLLTPDLSFSSVQTAGGHWLAEAGHEFGM